MKKTILLVLMAAMIVTPCFAQEVEPEGLFSIEGTAWHVSMVLPIFPLPPLDDRLMSEFYFHDGKVSPGVNSFFIDMLVFSIFSSNSLGYSGSSPMPFFWYFGILQPNGKGIVVEYVGSNYRRPAQLSIGFLIKTSDNWTPPEIE